MSFFVFIFYTSLMLWCVCRNRAHSSNAQKNVLLILVDDLRPALGCYNDDIAVTPNIDRLAEKSLLFRRTYAQQALCAPSRNSMLTSRRPDTLHLYDFYNYWRDTVGNFTTLPQYFKAHGYNTHAIGKIFHPGKSSNFTDDYPYSWSNRTFHPSTEAYMNAAVCYDRSMMQPKRNLLCPVNVMTQPEHTLPDIQSMQEAKRILKESERPFFVAVGLHKPHIPFRFPAKYLRYHRDLDKFDRIDFDSVPSELPTVAFNPYNDIRAREDAQLANISYPFGPINKKFGWKIRQAYYASVTYVDDLIGHILDGVDFANTIIVLTSDHGWALGEHAEWTKYSNYEVALQVPLIIYAPQFEQNHTKHISSLVELLDLFPTIVDLASLPPIERCHKSLSYHDLTCTDGKTLINHFKHTAASNRWSQYAISQYPRPGTFPTKNPDSDRPRLRHIKIMGYSIRTNKCRYTIWIKFNHKTFKRSWSRIYGEELYDHSIDPNELTNLATREQFNRLKLHLRQLLRDRLNDSINDTPTQNISIRLHSYNEQTTD